MHRCFPHSGLDWPGDRWGTPSLFPGPRGKGPPGGRPAQALQVCSKGHEPGAAELSHVGVQTRACKTNAPSHGAAHPQLCLQVHERFMGGQRMAHSQLHKRRLQLCSRSSHVLNICSVDGNPIRVVLRNRATSWPAGPEEALASSGMEGLHRGLAGRLRAAGLAVPGGGGDRS